MADILKIFLLIVGGLLIFIAFWLAAEALFPALVERSRDQYRRPWKLTFAGLAMAGPLIGLALLCFKKGNNPLFNIAGIISIGVVLLGIGAGLPSPIDDAQPWRRVLRGGIVLTLTFLLPFIGWMGLSVWTLVTGFAALVFAVREAKPTATVPPAPQPPVESKNEPPPIPAAA
jgi:hypothetical protein